MSAELTEILGIVISIVMTLCISYTKQANQRAEKLAEAVLVQNNKISDLEKKLAVAEYQIREMETDGNPN